MEKKPVKKPVKKPKKTTQKQKQKQKQSVRVVVNIGKDGKPTPIRNPNAELVMYAPPTIFTKSNIQDTFRQSESNQPFYTMPTATRPSGMPFMNEPVRQPVFFPEETASVEFLPDVPVYNFQPTAEQPIVQVPNTESEIVNQLTDDPYQINAGVIDEFNERTGETDYIQTQAPTYDMTIFNPTQESFIEDMKPTQNYVMEEYNEPKRKPPTFDIGGNFIRQPMPMTLENIYKSNNDNFISETATEDYNSPLRGDDLYSETRRNLRVGKSPFTYVYLRTLPIEEITAMTLDYNLDIVNKQTGRKYTKEQMIQNIRSNVKN